jgi:hypothetical protein
VGVASDNAHPGTIAIINEIPMNFWKDFMAFLWFLSYQIPKPPNGPGTPQRFFAGIPATSFAC